MAKKQQEIAVKKEGLPSALIDDLMNKYEGAGTSQRAEDNLIPMLYVLQDNSPQTKRGSSSGKGRDPKYIEGAEPGMLFLNNPPTLYADQDGILFQPCHFHKAIVEWIPRAQGGGIVTSYEEWPEGAREVPHPEDPNRKIMKLGDNDLVDTRYHAGNIVLPDGSWQPAVIPFKSTGHTISKGWMVLMNQHRRGGRVIPSFLRLYRLRTIDKTNAWGTFYVFDIQNEGPVTDPTLAEAGAMLYEAMLSGDKQVDVRGETDVKDTF